MKEEFQRKLNPVWMWVIAVRGARSAWINYDTIARTKRDSEGRYISQWDDAEAGRGYLNRDEARAIKVVVNPNP